MKPIKIIPVFLCILFLGTIDGYSQMTSDEALSVFVAAGLAYKDGRYNEAISRYEKILEGRRVSGPLYYNLANSYYKKRNLGKAVLNYERARQFIPRDSDLNFNYRYVHSKIEHYGVGEESNFSVRLIRGFIQFYTKDEMVIILVIVGMLAGILFLVSLYINLPGLFNGGIIVLLLMCFLIYGVGVIVKGQHGKDKAIIMNSAESYFEPRTDSTAHFKLSEGMKATILKTEGHWIKIRRLDGKTGWVDRDVLEKI